MRGLLREKGRSQHRRRAWHPGLVRSTSGTLGAMNSRHPELTYRALQAFAVLSGPCENEPCGRSVVGFCKMAATTRATRSIAWKIWPRSRTFLRFKLGAKHCERVSHFEFRR